MKIRDGIILGHVAGRSVLIDINAAEQDDKLVTTNETGAFLVDRLAASTDEDALIKAMTDHYEVDEATAKEHVDLFLDGLRSVGFIEE